MGRGGGGILETKVEGADREEGCPLSRLCIVYMGGEWMTVSHRKLFSQGDVPSNYVKDESDMTEMKLHVSLSGNKVYFGIFPSSFQTIFCFSIIQFNFLRYKS